MIEFCAGVDGQNESLATVNNGDNTARCSASDGHSTMLSKGWRLVTTATQWGRRGARRERCVVALARMATGDGAIRLSERVATGRRGWRGHDSRRGWRWRGPPPSNWNFERRRLRGDAGALVSGLRLSTGCAACLIRLPRTMIGSVTCGSDRWLRSSVETGGIGRSDSSPSAFLGQYWAPARQAAGFLSSPSC